MYSDTTIQTEEAVTRDFAGLVLEVECREGCVPCGKPGPDELASEIVGDRNGCGREG